jgi:hypothetical protein
MAAFNADDRLVNEHSGTLKRKGKPAQCRFPLPGKL